MTTDNPIITCTQMQLAFVAWQMKRTANGNPVDEQTLDLDNDSDSESTTEFREWWSKNGPFSSLRETCSQAWRAARDINVSGQFARVDAERFTTWWQTVLDAQPVVTP